MTVEELRAILDDLDGDMEVIFDDYGEPGLGHYVMSDTVEIVNGDDIKSISGADLRLPQEVRKDMKFVSLG